MADTNTLNSPLDDKKSQQQPVRKPKPDVWKVRTHNPDSYEETAARSTVFQSESEAAARTYIRKNHPRGREVYLLAPDGAREHYSADLEAQGDDSWLEYGEDEDA